MSSRPTIALSACMLAIYLFPACVLALTQTSVSFNPKLIWSFDSKSPIFANPTSDSQNIFFANSAGMVYALEQHNGSVRWSYNANAPILSDLSLHDSSLFFQADNGSIYRLNSKSGELIWQNQISKPETSSRKIRFEPNGWDYRSSRPVVYDDMIYVGSADSKLHVLDFNTGDIIWETEVDNKVRSAPLVTEDKVVFPSFGGFVYCLDRISGKIVWQFNSDDHVEEKPFTKIINSDPILHYGQVIIGSRNTYLYALSLNTGKLVWQYPYKDSWVESTASVFDNTIYIGSSFKRAQLAFTASNGKLLWQNRSADGLSFARLTVSKDSIYAGTVGVQGDRFKNFLVDGFLLKLDRKEGREIWRFPIKPSKNILPYGVISSPIVIDDMVLFGGLDGAFYAIKDEKTEHGILSFTVDRDKLKAGESTTLRWKTIDNAKAILNGKDVAQNGSLNVSAQKSQRYVLHTEFTTSGGLRKEESAILNLVSLEPEFINIAYYGSASASSFENNDTPLSANFVIDADLKTRWSSTWQDGQWIQIDLGKEFPIRRIVLHWEEAFASSYRILVSASMEEWNDLYENKNSSGGVEDIELTEGYGRYIRIVADKRATEYGASLYEVEVYETATK